MSDLPNETIVDTNFLLWLTDRGLTVNVPILVSSLKEIAAYAQEKKMVNESFLAVIDRASVKKVNDLLVQNRFFRKIHKNDIKKIDQAMRYLLIYTKEMIPAPSPKPASTSALRYAPTPVPPPTTATSPVLSAEWATRLNAQLSAPNQEPKPHDTINDTNQAEEAAPLISPANQEMLVDFTHIDDYSFAKPISLQYFDETPREVQSWTALFLALLSCLHADYPDIIRAGAVLSDHPKQQIDIASRNAMYSLRAPRQIPSTDLFAETNNNASDVMNKCKRALDLCRVDYENAVIAYRMNSNTGANGYKSTSAIPAVPAKEASSVPIPATAIAQTAETRMIDEDEATMQVPSGTNLPRETGSSMPTGETARNDLAEVPEEWIRFTGANGEQFVNTEATYCRINGTRFIRRKWTSILREIVNAELLRGNPRLERLYQQPLIPSNNAMPFFMSAYYNGSNCVQVENGFWIEMKYSAPMMMRVIYEFCIVCGYSADEIVLYGALKNNDTAATAAKQPSIPADIMTGGDGSVHSSAQSNSDADNRMTADTFYAFLHDELHMAEASCRSYVSAIRMSEQFANTHGYRLGCSTESAAQTVDALLADPDFMAMNQNQHNRFTAALNKLLLYFRRGSAHTEGLTIGAASATATKTQVGAAAKNEVQKLLSDKAFAPLLKVLTRQGITTIDALRSIKIWSFLNRNELYSISTRQDIALRVQALLSDLQINDGGAYAIYFGTTMCKGATPSIAYLRFCNAISCKYPLKIRRMIDTKLQCDGFLALYSTDDTDTFLKMENPVAFIDPRLSADAVQKLARMICSECGMDWESVRVEPLHTAEAQPVQRTASATAPLPKVSLTSSAEDFVLSADMDGTTLDALQHSLQTTMVATKQTVAASRRIVEVNGRLYHEDAILDWEDAAKGIAAIMDKLMQRNNGYVSAAQLYEYARVDLHMFLNDNDMDNERAVYDIANHLFDKLGYQGKHYKFSGKMHISTQGNDIKNAFDIMQNYAEDQGGVFSLTDLETYLKQIDVSTANLRNQLKINAEPWFLYYEDGILINTRSMKIDAEWKATVKNALADLFADVGNHIILREIQPLWFSRLPSLPGGSAWKPLLLQCVLRFYGKELGARTIPAMDGQAFETLHAMLVSNNSPIRNFGDVVVAYFEDADIKQRVFEAEELRGVLAEAGILRGNELIYNMPKALGKDGRFAWDATGKEVTIRM